MSKCFQTRPTFDIEGGKGRFCSKHKTPDMINIKNNYQKRCEYQGCKSYSLYNLFGQKAKFCSKHKTSEMINVISKLCEYEGCNIVSTFDIEGGKGKFCSKHKTPEMSDVKHKNLKCKTDLCDTRVSNLKYEGYCLRCFFYIFPDKPISLNYKTKEKAVIEFVKQNNNEINMTFDKIINGGCSKKRPDILMDLISHDLGYPHIVFIRFNPDSFEHNIIIPSCWAINKNGTCVLKDIKG
jgi:hypothetical protein